MTIPKSQAELQHFIQKPSYGKVTRIHERALKSRTLTHATLVAISEHVKITKDQHIFPPKERSKTLPTLQNSESHNELLNIQLQ